MLLLGWLADMGPTGVARACVARVDRQVTKEQVCLRTTRWHAATSEGESWIARAQP